MTTLPEEPFLHLLVKDLARIESHESHESLHVAKDTISNPCPIALSLPLVYQ